MKVHIVEYQVSDSRCLNYGSELDFINIESGLSLIQNSSSKIIHFSDKIIRNVKSRIYNLPMTLHKHQLYLLQQHNESFEVFSAIIRTNTEGQSLVMTLGPGLIKKSNILNTRNKTDLFNLFVSVLPL